MTTYTLACHGGAWWILGGEMPIGPYETRKEAESSRRGLTRTERYWDDPRYWSVDAPADPPLDPDVV